jgi:hypothetical protein
MNHEHESPLARISGRGAGGEGEPPATRFKVHAQPRGADPHPGPLSLMWEREFQRGEIASHHR